ncbi:MAG: hypothetical protein NTW87_16410 [Planctomycetota bacterium]|nr:hypothetical protein [Planctomycetota bacterium]
MTLVEVMMAFAILVTGLIGIFAVLNAGFRSHKRAINETEAGILAASVIAELRSEFSRGHLPRSDPKGTYNPYASSPRYQYRQQIIPLEAARRGIDQKAADREYFVRVEVRWIEGGDNKGVSLDTIIYCNRKD